MEYFITHLIGDVMGYVENMKVGVKVPMIVTIPRDVKFVLCA